MNTIDDERLIQYADGVLGDTERQEVDAYLERDPQARRFVADLKRSADLLQQAFGHPALESPPQDLVERVMAPAADVVHLPVRSSRAATPWAPIALAASIVLTAVLLVSGMQDNGDERLEAFAIALGPLADDSELGTVLEQALSGESRDLGESAWSIRAAPMLTFRDSRQRLCRELEVTQASGTITDLVIACRENSSHWNVEGVFRMASSVETTNGYQPAAGVQYEPADTLLKSIGAGEPVSPAEERRLIGSGWK